MRNPDGSYAVKNLATGQYKAKHTTKASAEAQLRLLHMIEAKSAKRKT